MYGRYFGGTKGWKFEGMCARDGGGTVRYAAKGLLNYCSSGSSRYISSSRRDNGSLQVADCRNLQAHCLRPPVELTSSCRSTVVVVVVVRVIVWCFIFYLPK